MGHAGNANACVVQGMLGHAEGEWIGVVVGAGAGAGAGADALGLC